MARALSTFNEQHAQLQGEAMQLRAPQQEAAHLR